MDHRRRGDAVVVDGRLCRINMQRECSLVCFDRRPPSRRELRRLPCCLSLLNRQRPPPPHGVPSLRKRTLCKRVTFAFKPHHTSLVIPTLRHHDSTLHLIVVRQTRARLRRIGICHLDVLVRLPVKNIHAIETLNAPEIRADITSHHDFIRVGQMSWLQNLREQ